jgi:hypothetical protein
VRTAEANVDAFWEWVDAYFEKKTGVGQHDVIRRCVLEGGQMQRTPLWIEPLQEAPKNSVERPEHIYQPFSRIYHAKEMQITGAFDKMSIIQKIKPKTRGSAAHDSLVSGTLEKEAASATRIKQAPSSLLDKRAYKAIEALFYFPTSEDGEFPKAIK